MSNGYPQPGQPLDPAEITRRINPSRRERFSIILSFPILVILALPFWWYTTSIQRLPLPIARISALEELPLPVTRSPILLSADAHAYPHPRPGKAQYTVKDVCEAIGKEVVRGTDGIYDQPRTKGERLWDLVYEEDRREPPALRILLHASSRANQSFPLEPYIQASIAGLNGCKPGTLVVPVHPSQVNDRFLQQHYKIALINSLLALYPSSAPEIPLRALRYTPNITLSFVLLNEDATEGSYVRSWDIEGAIRDHFLPHLEPLSPIFNFTIESQILYHAPLSFEPMFGSVPAAPVEEMVELAIEAAATDGHAAEEVAGLLIQEQSTEKAWLIDEEMSKVFVNSERWSLDSGSTDNPVLRFLVFVPAEKHRPMRLSVPGSAQSFLLPQFGAVTLLNPPPSAPASRTYHLPLSALTPTFHLFTQHLYSLLALPIYPPPPKFHPPPSASLLQPPSPLVPPLSRWQVETVLRQRMRENAIEARKTLAGIGRLVAKIKEMKVGTGVRGMVLGAVEKLERMQQTEDPLEAFLLSRDAVGLANQAFFDPSMMGLLYFPNEHKFAVYTPLFAPIGLPMAVGLLKELIGWSRRRKKAKMEQAKHAADAAKQAD